MVSMGSNAMKFVIPEENMRDYQQSTNNSSDCFMFLNFDMDQNYYRKTSDIAGKSAFSKLVC